SPGIGRAILLVAGLAVVTLGLIAGAGSQGMERRARGGFGYAGPSPFLVFGASIPASILVLVLVAVPLAVVGFPFDGPPGSLLSVAVQALIYISLIRLLVVDTGALDWAAMGLRRIDGRALGEIAGGALWALPRVLITGIVSSFLLQIFP